MQPLPQNGILSRSLLDVFIRAGLILVLVISCYEIFHPFLNLMIWALILGVTLYPLHTRIKEKLGLRDGYVATLIIVVALALLMVPIYLLGMSMAESVKNALEMVKNGDLRIPPPTESVAGWPLIGQWLYDFWQQASDNLTQLIHNMLPHVRDVGLTLLGKLAGVGAGFLTFLGALVIAGVFMAYGDNGHTSAKRIATRISGPDRGPSIAALCTATIRAVAQGVVGIAFVQMLLVGVGFVVMGIPGAGLLALLVLLIGIMQLPVLLITLPVVGYVFATEGASVSTIVFTIYSLLAGMSDNVLKPMLLGRGVNVPMPVVLIGALGGMVSNGIIGLFIGPVMLAVGYELFWAWVDNAGSRPAGDEKTEV
ncbi:AI-2E family transporter [Pseudomonas fontis]|uniref:AI-2E family transporter n=1 Tax=Pseudomonas fontis TaxID=2942633 RepID=A0ABT5NXY1_9PSED|nr:AI-2E family transporter [Pseudomonas fontis]MDD0972534.1 AI-2E family transporter [Pseudomonas fontis]MDD0993058.1 AI-2E family transporter [Pseudomonas fontis]